MFSKNHIWQESKYSRLPWFPEVTSELRESQQHQPINSNTACEGELERRAEDHEKFRTF